MKNQRGVALSGLLFWGFILFFVAILGMKVVPSVIEYYKILKGTKSTLAKMGPDSTVADVRSTFEKFADIDMLDFPAKNLDISKDNGRIVIEFAYEKRIPLFANVSLVIDYQGSTEQ